MCVVSWSLLTLLIVLSLISLVIIDVCVSPLTFLRWCGLLSWLSLLRMFVCFSSVSYTHLTLPTILLV